MIISDTNIIEGVMGAIGTAVFYLMFTQIMKPGGISIPFLRF